LAEERLLNSDDGGKIVLDAAWQDMLNHATAKVCDLVRITSTLFLGDVILPVNEANRQQHRMLHACNIHPRC